MNNYAFNQLEKIRWFVKRFGYSELFLKPIRQVFAPLIISHLKNKRFYFDEIEYNYLYHKYNTTWANERCVEVPIVFKDLACSWMDNKKIKILEVGNVLSHYVEADWDIIDKYEKGERVINSDAVDFKKKNYYDLIVSISTFEHIGYDEKSNKGSKEKIIEAIETMKKNLSKEGRLIITVPISYNPAIDEIIKEGFCGFDMKFMKRERNGWEETTREEALKHKYNSIFPYANAVMIGYYSKFP